MVSVLIDEQGKVTVPALLVEILCYTTSPLKPQ